MLHRTRLRNRGGKCEFITVIIVNDHYGFAFDFHFVRRGPASAEPGTYDAALVLDDYARDAMESRALNALRRLSVRKRTVAVQIIELLGG